MKVIEDFTAVHIARSEFTRMGQAGILGVYPIHFHMVGDVSGKAYVRHNSIHHNYQVRYRYIWISKLLQRCVVIHGTHNLLVQGNVAHETFGHW